MVTPPMTRSKYGPKCLMSPVNKCVARSDRAASRIETSRRKSHALGQRANWQGTDELYGPEHFFQASALIRLGKVASGFLGGVKGRNKSYVSHLPELQESRAGIVCGGEENVGVQENSVQWASAFRGAVMPDPVRVEPHFPDALTRPSIIRRADGIG